jgi:hypothetical protein
MAKEFIDAVKTKRRALSDGQSGLNVVKILEAADRSLHAGGQVVKLTSVNLEKEQYRLAFGAAPSHLN